MNTTEGTKYRFFHNGDYSGDVKAMNKETKEEIEIPFEDLKRLVANWVMVKKISQIEQADDDELLLQSAKLNQFDNQPTKHVTGSVKKIAAAPCSLFDFKEVINNAPVEWVEEKIHPYVPRMRSDNDASYLRRMAMWAQSTNTFPEND